jgi:hypothetical protein
MSTQDCGIAVFSFSGIKERIEDKLDEIKKERQQKINEKKLSLNKHPEPALPVNEESNEANENKKKTEVVIEKKTQEIEEKTEKGNNHLHHQLSLLKLSNSVCGW